MSFYRLRRDGIACSDLGSEIVILDLNTSSYFAASASAAVLVNALIEGASAEDLVGRLLDSYEVAPHGRRRRRRGVSHADAHPQPPGDGRPVTARSAARPSAFARLRL